MTGQQKRKGGPQQPFRNQNNKKKRVEGYNAEVLKELKSGGPQGSPRSYTLSIAVPGSILDTIASPELRSYVTGQIARAAAVFSVDEVVVYDEQTKRFRRGDSCTLMSKVLQFLECPQYLRKFLFPIQEDLKFAGLLNPLQCPHHLGAHEVCRYRDGLVLDKKSGNNSLVDIGLTEPVEVDQTLSSGLRVTVKLRWCKTSNGLKGKVVSPSEPQRKHGIYWGYSTRVAGSLSEVMSECPYDGGYDLLLGTSDKGKKVRHVKAGEYKHIMIVFGGLKGIEAALNSDDSIAEKSTSKLFHYYLNTCPDQGSKTIRTEEAIFISLTAITAHLDSKKMRKAEVMNDES